MKIITNFKRLVTCILCCFLLISFSSFTEADEKNKSTIIGYGPIAGDLVKPSSTLVYDDKLYVLDQTGISVFDLQTKKLIHKHLASYQKNFLADFEDVQNLYSFYDNLFKGHIDCFSPRGKNKDFSKYAQQKYYVQPTMCLDSGHTLYISSQEGIHVLSIESMELHKTIPYPKELLEQVNDNYVNIITFKLYQGQIYFLKTVYKWGQKANSMLMFQLDNDGSIINTIDFQFDNYNGSRIYEPDFIYVQEFDLYGIIYFASDYYKKGKDEKPNPVLWFNSQGENVVIENSDGLPDDCTRIDYCLENQQIILTGYDYTFQNSQPGQFVLFRLHLERKDDHTYTFVLDSTEQKEEFGYDCMDITLYDDSIMMISTGQFQEAWNCRVYRLTESDIEQYGTTPNRIGQINESMSFCIDTSSTLYTHNNSQTFLNLFDASRVCDSTIDLSYDLMSPFCGTANSTFLSDIIFHDDTVAFVGVSPNTVTEYSLQDETWKQLYNGFSWFPGFWSGIQYYDHEYNLLHPLSTEEQTPSLYTIKDDSHTELIESFQKANENFEEPPIFIGFKMIDIPYQNKQYLQYQFLDCVHQSIWIYDHRKKLQEIVQLPQNENSFYSSFDLYPDGSWIVTDVTQHRLLHIDRNGELIETIGSKGRVNIGTTKEAYLENPDQFYFPLRAKIANNNIYVADFGNCRYHTIPIGPLSIQWKDDAIHHENVSIFSSESGILQYDVSIPSTVSYEVTSTVPWLVIRHQYGSLQDKQIYYHILAEQLVPWQTHIGEIHVTFPQKWSFLNHSIPISVSTIGSTVELTIGSGQANVDGKPVALEEGYIPVIQDGRTCIGIRFLTDYLFRSHATIEYEADLQRIKVTTKDHTIYMIINQDAASVDGVRVLLDVPPFIQEGRTMIPLRFVSESLEADVLWEPSTQNITINYPSR
jgi:hypothetical protein